MHPNNLDSDETRQHLGKRALQMCSSRVSPGSQESQQANGEECGGKEVPHPVAALGFWSRPLQAGMLWGSRSTQDLDVLGGIHAQSWGQWCFGKSQRGNLTWKNWWVSGIG